MPGDSNTLPTWGNAETMNMNPIIYQNILESRYFQSLYDKTTFHEMINEIFNEVSHLHPFVTGTTASTAFCCLYKLWQLQLTVKQLENMIDHKDSPYIRAIGFLYLRYVCAPDQLWEWLGYYLEDDQQVNLSNTPKPNMKSIGALCRMLLTDQKYLTTMLPRIPVLIARDIEKKLQEYDRENGTAPAGGAKGGNQRDRGGRSRSPPHRRRDSPPRRRHDSSDRRRRDDDDDRRSKRRSDRYSDDLDDYERRSRGRRSDRRSRSRSPSYDRRRDRDRDRHRRRDDDSDDDYERRRKRRRSPSVTRDRPGEYRR
ncbi:PRP38 family-domain-containing protein [Gongronella butleri]|nr:PRP38 family-domain-containing protein [Gongronella butleri]